MRDERDGVELEISSDAEKLNEKRKIKASRGVHKKVPAEKKLTTAQVRAMREEKLKNMENEYDYTPYADESSDKTFYIYGLLIAIVVCIAAFYFIFMYTSNNTQNTGSNTGSNANNITQPSTDGSHELDEELLGEYRSVTGYVTAIDTEFKTIDLLNIENGEVLNIVVANSTAITDAYGRALVFSEIALGDGLEVNYVRANNMAVSIDKPDTFFTKPNKTGVVVNTASKSLNHNNTNYYTTNYTIIVNQDGDSITLDEISDKDYITFKGISNYVNYIEVVKGHGTIQFTNINTVKNPRADINTKNIIDLTEQTSYVAGEGSYKVVITGDNITPYIQYITVDSGKTEEIDLNLATGMLGTTYVVTNVDNVVLKINDKEYDETKPITLPYGDYVATASKLNYAADTVSFTVDKPVTNLVFNLVPIETSVILDIATTPSGAEVYVDNQLIGITPIKYSTTAETHQITVKYTGKYDYAFTIDGSENYYRYNYTLIDKPATTVEDDEAEIYSTDEGEE